ncbi:MAG: S41 family peptidase [Bacteroidota bacterium]
MLTLLLGLLLSGLAADTPTNTEVYFTSAPTVSPDGSQIVFTYEGDLWRVPTTGGTAQRLTAMEGEETEAHFSPDGQWLAFTGRQQSNADVYVLPMDGGDIRPLTVHSANDHVDGWSWDSQQVYFSSRRHNRVAIYTVPLTGGTPRRFVDHYFNTVHHAAEHPETGAVFFTDTWESDNFANRKRYRGAFNPDLKSYHPETGAYTVHTRFEGKDLWPTIDRSGTVYFASDRANGEYNLYRLTDGEPEALTNFPTSIKRPQVSANGQVVVFERDYQLWRYDVSAGQASRVPVQLYSNNTLTLAQDFNVKGALTAFDVAPDHKKLAFVSRGELFVSDLKGQFIRPLPTTPDERVVQVKWLADSQRLLFSQTDGGYLNLFTIAADGSAPAEQHTQEAQNHQVVVLNPERTQAAFQVGRGSVQVMDLDSFERTVVHEDEFWALYPTPPAFSPDGAYLAFTAYRNFEQDLMLHHLDSGQTVNLTETGVTETSPAWALDGQALYFAAHRTQEVYPRGNAPHDIYRLPLTRTAPPYRADRFDALFAVEDTTETEEAEAPSTTLDLDTLNPADLATRWETVARYVTAQRDPIVLGTPEKTTVLFTSNHDEGRTAVWKVTMEPFEAPKTEKVTDGAFADVVEVDGTVYVLQRGTLHTLSLDSNSLKAIDIEHPFSRTLADEFRQMYHEAWANVEENYYDETFQGTDWGAMRDRYAQFLPHLRSRVHLRILLSDLLGELNSSHVGFFSSGEEEEPFYEQTTLTIGATFEHDDPYTVNAVLRHGRLAQIGADVQPGDVLVAVDGERVDPAMNREHYFVRPMASEEMALTFQRGGDEYTVRLRPERANALSRHLYDAWIDDNQARVDAQGDQRIAYVHMKNMGGGSLEQFLIEMTQEGYTRDGLILDLRYNTGGNVHDDVLQFLQQTSYLQWKYRGGALTQQPAFAPSDKPMVLLINEQTLSDAEMTATGFKELALGPVIGTETYRWIIFTSGKGLVDGSFYRLPSWGCYTLDGRDLERTGVQPDVLVETTFEDRVQGEDPQLDRAIQTVLNALEATAEPASGGDR